MLTNEEIIGFQTFQLQLFPSFLHLKKLDFKVEDYTVNCSKPKFLNA